MSTLSRDPRNNVSSDLVPFLAAGGKLLLTGFEGSGNCADMSLCIETPVQQAWGCGGEVGHRLDIVGRPKSSLLARARREAPYGGKRPRSSPNITQEYRRYLETHGAAKTSQEAASRPGGLRISSGSIVETLRVGYLALKPAMDRVEQGNCGLELKYSSLLGHRFPCAC